LISGYFLVDSKFKLEKVIQIWLQMFFYSAGIYLLFKATGNLAEVNDSTYFKVMFFMPAGMKHNWFPSIYLILYLVSPFLAVMVKKISKRQLQACIVILMLIFSKISRIIYPMSEGFDDNGYGIIWMVCLFMIAGYIKLYVPISGKWGKHMWVYISFSLMTVISYFAISTIYFWTGKGGKQTMLFFAYNSPTVIIASVALFIAFLNMGQKKRRESDKEHPFIKKMVLYIASLTFGIYLIHEHILLRDLWTKLWKVPEAFEQNYFILHFIGVVLLVFVLCGIIEACRKWIFGFLFRSRLWSWVKIKTTKINAIMNGEV
jgi:surface polysaccharide O-acyltransferase-like enzyme